MSSLTADRGRISRRVAAGIVALALAIAAPVALASSTSSRPGQVHVAMQRSGAMIVSGYDGGAPLAPGPSK